VTQRDRPPYRLRTVILDSFRKQDRPRSDPVDAHLRSEGAREATCGRQESRLRDSVRNVFRIRAIDRPVEHIDDQSRPAPLHRESEFGREQNTDWAFLGFQPNAVVAMLQMGEDIKKTFPTDYYGTPVDKIALMENIQNYDQVPAVLSLAGTAVAEYWASYPGMRYGVTVLTGLTAVYVADIVPFYQSGQIKGLLGGLKGAAEYEQLVAHPGSGTAGMRSQKVVHYMIILFIVLGNIAYLATRGRSR